MSSGFLPHRQEAHGCSPLTFPSFLALVALLIVGLAAAAWAANPITVLVTRSFDGGRVGKKATVDTAAISGDGRWVAFVTNAINFTPTRPGANNNQNIFAKNTSTGALEWVSVGLGDVMPNGNSGLPSLSADGQYVAFQSIASNLISSDTNNAQDIFVRNLVTSSTSRVSLGPGGAQANGFSASASISPDGRYVAFVSGATNLVAGDTNGFSDVFVRDLVTGTTTLASLGPGGVQSNYYCYDPSISADGRYVAFTSQATNLVPGGTNGYGNVFVRDLSTNVTTLVSVGLGGAQSTGFLPSISGDGRYVAFTSEASNLVPNDNNRAVDVFVRDLSAGTTTRITSGANGEPWSGASPAFSTDGRYVAFASKSGGLTDIYVRDLSTNATAKASVGVGGAYSNGKSDFPAINGDGRYVAFESAASNLVPGDSGGFGIFVRDMSAGVTTKASMGPDGEEGHLPAVSYGTAVSPDGRTVAFDTDGFNLITGDANNRQDTFVRNLSTGVLTQVSVGASAAGGGSGGEDPYVAPMARSPLTPAVSWDGRYVAFRSNARDLTPNSWDLFYPEVFVRDMVTGTTTFASRWPNGSKVLSIKPSLSWDGRYLAFQSLFGSIYVRDLTTGTFTFPVVNVDGKPTNYVSYNPSISGDGRYLAFESYAPDLVPGDTNEAMDIYVRDMVGATTTRASVGLDGVQPNGWSGNASISAGGRYVAFESWASNLVPGDTNSESGQSGQPHQQFDIFVRDLVTGTTVRASVGPGGVEANGDCNHPSISADGRFVAFDSGAKNLVPGDTNNTRDIFVRDLRAGTTTRISVNANGIQANGYSSGPSISADGRVVSYISNSTNLTDDPTYGSNNVFATTLPTAPPIPGTPSNLTAVASTSRRVNLDWTDNTNNETGFEIWASLNGGPFLPVGNTAANQTTYQHLGPEGNYTIRYKVCALTADSQTAFSNIATAILMAQPLGLTSKALDSITIDVRWKDNATNEGKYEVWRSVGNGAFTLLATKNAGATQHTDTVPAGNQTYTYKVCGRNGVHLSSFSNQDPAVTMRVPTNLALQATGGQVKLSWTDNSGALETGFQIYRRTSAPRSQTLVGTTAANATTFTDTTAGVNEAYWYEVRAANGTDSSSFTSLAPILPLPSPAPLTAKALNSTSVDLRWKDNATNETNYEIWRSVGGSAFTLRYTTPFANATQYTDTVPAGDAVYTYMVRAKSGANYSYYSNQDGATTLLAPTDLNATPVSSTQVDLTWTDNSSRETGFQVFRRSPADTSWVLVATLGANSTGYSDGTAQAGTSYSYEVRAIAGTDGSSYTNIVQVTTP